MRKRSQSLSANDPRHRRLLAPRKSILKASSVDNTTEDLESTSKSEFDPRKSLNRRVSFAQNVSCRYVLCRILVKHVIQRISAKVYPE